MRAVPGTKGFLGLFVPLLLSGCGTTPGMADDDGPLIPLRDDCTLSESVPLDGRAFIDDPDRYVGKCVHARGIIAFRKYYPDVSSLYEPIFEENGEDFIPRMIGIYGRQNETWPDLWVIREAVDIVAFAYTCGDWGRYSNYRERQRREAAIARGEDPGIVISMMAGECHYHNVPILYVTELKVREGDPRRLTRQEAPPEYGDLVEVENGWEYFEELSRIVTTVYARVRDRDAGGLIAEAQAQAETNGEDFSRRLIGWEIEALMADESPFAFLFGSTTQPNIRYFRVPSGAWQEPGDYLAFGCVCKEESCEDHWPIASGDTENGDDWPYVCVQVERIHSGELLNVRTY